MDGFEVLRRLRADPATARLPVMVVTGREDVAAIDRAFEAGATSFISKPINWRLLSYQLRYVHRTFCAERAIAEQREQAQKLMAKVALEGSHFMAAGLRANPELRAAALAFAQAIEAAGAPAEADADSSLAGGPPEQAQAA
jgi:response regulator RpfG family c-di-GMP phosphodiesterase